MEKYIFPLVIFFSGLIFFKIWAISETNCEEVKPALLLLNFLSNSVAVSGFRDK